MNEPDHESHVSDLKIDRMLAGELSDAQRGEVTAHAASCAPCKARLAAITAERDAFAQRPVPIAFAKAKRSLSVAVTASIGALAAAAVLVLVLRPARKPPIAERPKGGGTILLLAAGSPDILGPVESSDEVHPGDFVQAGYHATVDGFGSVLSIDGAGHASIYVPATGDAMVPLPAGRERLYPNSTILDDVIGTELIAVVWCVSAHPTAPLLAELKATKNLVAPAGCTVRVVTLDKRAAR